MSTARQRFIESSVIADFQKIVATKAMDAACDYALLALEEEMPSTLADPTKAWDYGAQMIGARRVLSILKNLHLPQQQPEGLKPRKLNYGA